MKFNLLTLKRGLLFFWSLWLTIVLLTNVTDLLKQAGVLGADWSLASGNYGFMQATTAIHHLPDALVLILFLGVIVWEALATLLLWRAFAAFRGAAAGGLDAVYSAFAVSLALWAALMIADEILIAYSVEGTHMSILVAQIATLLLIRLLPEDA
ncbi:MAG: hypothetical protein ABI835_07270 [Chloroflexota bacterium]